MAMIETNVFKSVNLGLFFIAYGESAGTTFKILSVLSAQMLIRKNVVSDSFH